MLPAAQLRCSWVERWSSRIIWFNLKAEQLLKTEVKTAVDKIQYHIYHDSLIVSLFLQDGPWMNDSSILVKMEYAHCNIQAVTYYILSMHVHINIHILYLYPSVSTLLFRQSTDRLYTSNMILQYKYHAASTAWFSNSIQAVCLFLYLICAHPPHQLHPTKSLFSPLWLMRC